jgi:hypothetical protein
MKAIISYVFLASLVLLLGGCVQKQNLSKQHVPEQTHKNFDNIKFTKDEKGVEITLSTQSFMQLPYYDTLNLETKKEFGASLTMIKTIFALYEAALISQKKGYQYFTIEYNENFLPINSLQNMQKYCFAYLFEATQHAYCPSYTSSSTTLKITFVDKPSVIKPTWSTQKIIAEFNSPISGTKFDDHINAIIQERKNLTY